MARYRYEGPLPWRRPSGEYVRRGEVFTATEREHARFQRRRAAQFVLLTEDGAVEASAPAEQGAEAQGAGTSDGEGSAPPEGEEDGGTGTSEHAAEEGSGAREGSAASPPVWPLKMAPDVYLRLHPTGGHAATARAVLEVGAHGA